MARPRTLLLTLLIAATLVLSYTALSRRVRAGELLLALSGAQRGKPLGARAAVETDLALPSALGSIRARLYRSGEARGPGLVLAHGVHWRGIDEKRLVAFARELARAGLVVVTPELSELADYRITRQGVTVIGDTVRWLSARRDLVSEPRVGILGLSFAGGLSLVAAADPELAARVAYVTSVGGHHDLERVLGFLLSDEVATPSGVVHEKAHEYGLVVWVYGNVERFVDPPDVETMRSALRNWLREDRKAALAVASLRQTESAERLFGLLEAGTLRVLRPELESLLRERSAELAELSPSGRLRDVRVPVYLLHGSNDSVIPPSETEWADLELAGSPHRALVSPLLEHVEVNQAAGLREKLALVEFMAQLL